MRIGAASSCAARIASPNAGNKEAKEHQSCTILDHRRRLDLLVGHPHAAPLRESQISNGGPAHPQSAAAITRGERLREPNGQAEVSNATPRQFKAYLGMRGLVRRDTLLNTGRRRHPFRKRFHARFVFQTSMPMIRRSTFRVTSPRGPCDIRKATHNHLVSRVAGHSGDSFWDSISISLPSRVFREERLRISFPN